MTTVLNIPALEALLWAAFGGEPGYGRRELRLSPQERDYIHTSWPAARLLPLPGEEGEGRAWYALCFD